MNKFKLFPLALAAFAFSACTSEDAVENNPNVEGVKSYVAVNINNVGAGGTRANGYEYGDANENAISKVRFYLFTQSGQPYMVAGNKSYVDVTPTFKGGSGDNVEKISDAVLVIEGASKTAPYSMMAVANPDLLGTALQDKMSRSDVENAVADKAFSGNEDTAADFVMSSSVYAEGGVKMWTSDISGYVQTTKEAALTAPVDIYVERVAAKLMTSTGGEVKTLTDATTGQEFKAYLVGQTTEGKDVYAKINGWGLADESKQANLIKDIDPAWAVDYNGFSEANPWNVEALHRCFWETSIEFTNTKKTYNNFTTTSEKPYYTLPNTTALNPQYVVAAKLVYADGTPAEISSYKGVEYLSENDVKKVILAENKKFFKKDGVTAEGTNKYANLDPEDITFVVKADGSYEVKAQLDGEFELFEKVGDSYNPVTAVAVNAKLGETAAQIRKGGMAYYYTDIKHLNGKSALVRNHVYKIDIQKITGFGTPVYNPDNGFDPTKPDKVETFLAAKINVLSWRVVNQSVNLE